MVKFNIDDKERLYTTREVAQSLSVTPAAVTNWLSNGKMEGFKANSRWRIKGDAVFRFVENSTSGQE